MKTLPTVMKAMSSFITTLCVILNNVPKYNQSYKDRHHVYLLNKLP